MISLSYVVNYINFLLFLYFFFFINICLLMCILARVNVYAYRSWGDGEWVVTSIAVSYLMDLVRS